MSAYVAGRLGQGALVMLIVGLCSFLVLRFLGDPVASMVGIDTPQGIRDSLRAGLGLDDPLPLQYFRFLARAVTGDFGLSYQNSRPVIEVIAERLPATLELTLVAAVLASLAGIPMGVFVALRRRSVAAKSLMAASLIGVSLPTFVTGILLILVFSVNLGWLPSYGRGETVMIGWWRSNLLSPGGWLPLLMPGASLAVIQTTLVMRLVRAEMLEVLQTDYIRFARARGLTNRVVHFGHALKNTLVPVITIIGLQIGTLIAFAIVTETVFQWPGMGLLFIQAVSTVDVPVITGFLMIVALVFVVINLVVDLTYFVVDPRLRIDRAVAAT